ncbi:MAG TPA: YfbK domain-containing protein, partial [Thermoguttaceae bacterium]|nr:YfbK domain-containing protein [Thermoguttaceae bacterium]
LLDVSGSMDMPDKLPLLKAGMKLLAEQMRENDRVAIVVYAGSEGLVLPSTPGSEREKILEKLDSLTAGGSTNGGAGIELAYRLARENYIKDGVNRVILCTDGDFNVGTTSTADLVRMVEQKAKAGVFLSVLGFGRGNLNDSMMETIADKGNGNYAYLDTLGEARKVLVEQMGGTLVTIAKDVKIQIEFNPARVAAYRLIGYENRILAKEDFNDDKKDAGEVGAGHTVTALYEVVPVGVKVDTPPVDPLKYQKPASSATLPVASPVEGREAITSSAADASPSDELLTVKLRYKEPDAEKSRRLEFPLVDRGESFARADHDFQFAAAVAEFGMLLRGSKYKGTATYDAALETAAASKGPDPHGYRAEFLEMIRRAKAIAEGERREKQ